MVSKVENDTTSTYSNKSDTNKEHLWKLQVFLENGGLGSAASLSFTILKLISKVKDEAEKLSAKAILIIINMLKLIELALSNQFALYPSNELKINVDALDRLAMCFKFLSRSSSPKFEDETATSLIGSIFTPSLLKNLPLSPLLPHTSEVDIFLLFNIVHFSLLLASMKIFSDFPTYRIQAY